MTDALFDLTGHVALITGGNSGIGLGMARGLARCGAAVAIWGTNETKNAAALEELLAIGGEAAAFRCDVGEEEQVEAAFAATLERFGRVDSCCANAGIGGGARSFMEMTTDEWHRVLRVNLDGAFWTLRAAARHMVERGGGGSLSGTASIAAVSGQPRGQHYAATKGGLVSMLKACAVELARYKIRANTILPGWIDTPLTGGMTTAQPMIDKVLTRIPARRWGDGDDFAGIAAFLASDAGSYVTGQTFVVDGGYTIF